jgi:hypothetical protein
VKVRVSANSPQLASNHLISDKDRRDAAVAPPWSEPMKSNEIERRDQVLIGFCALLAAAFSALLHQ